MAIDIPNNNGKHSDNQTDVHADNRYVRGVADNDYALLDEIYTLFLPGISKFIHKNSGNEDDALDVFQEAIMVIYNKALHTDFVISQSFFNYLYTICRNLWMRELERRKKIRVTSFDLMIEEDLIIEEEILSEAADEQIAQKLFKSKFQELGEGCQEILKLFFEGESMKSIAKKMGFASDGYAKKRKHLCQKKLIALIENDPNYKTILEENKTR